MDLNVISAIATLAALAVQIAMFVWPGGLRSATEMLTPRQKELMAARIKSVRVNFSSVLGFSVGIVGIILLTSITSVVTPTYVLSIVALAMFSAMHLAAIALYRFMCAYSDKLINTIFDHLK